MSFEEKLFIVRKALYEDWRKTKIKPDGSYDDKLYLVEDEEFIERLKKDKFCNYEINSNGKYMVQVQMLDFEDLPKDILEEHFEDDKKLLELCERYQENDKEELAKIYHEFYDRNCKEIMPFNSLPESDKQFYYNLIDVCFKTLKTIE